MLQVPLIVRSLLAFLLFASPALAASISIIPARNPASFSVVGSDMDGVAGIQLDIAYDEASLATPTVTQGGLVTGAMLAANTSRPGFIKIAIISTRTFSGSGRIADITFTLKGASAPIPSLQYSMIGSKGAAITASTSSIVNETALPDPSPSPGAPFNQSSQPTSNTPAATMPTYPGTITLPTGEQQADTRPAPNPAVPADTGDMQTDRSAEQSQPSGKPAPDAKAEESPQRIVYKGVLDRFKSYTGSKSFSAIIEFFTKKVAKTINQEPALVISDGKSKATLTIDIPARIDSSPNFAVNGGRLLSLRQDKQSKNRWIVDVLPEAGSIMVSVTIMAGVDEFEFSLAVSPPLAAAITLDEQGWNRFLKEVGTSKAPLHDFNNDGVRDYIDEYIFVANYLSNRSTVGKAVTIKEKKKK